MKLLPLLLALVTSSSLAVAKPISDEVHTIHDSGQLRSFRIAPDELESLAPGKSKSEAVRLAPRAAAALAAHAKALENASGSPHDLVLYEDGKAHDKSSRRVLTRKVLVLSESGFDPARAAALISAVNVHPAPYAAGYFIFQLKGAGDSLTVLETLRGLPGVVSAEPLLAKMQNKRLIPNDTLFAYNAGQAGYQWHLRNTGQRNGTTGIDVNITSVWDTYKGTGVRIGIVDDGMEVAHPDLSPNADTVNDHDWNDATPNDPTGDPNNDTHGTACAGVAAARGNNGSGVTGAAFNSTLVGLRLIAGNVSDADEAAALSWKNDIIQLYSNSWGPNDDAKNLNDAGPLVKQAFINGSQTGRGGRGTIWLWAAGNGGDVADNSNYDGYSNSIYTIPVGAMNDNGVRSNYSEPGANVVVVAPSNDIVGNHQGITTTTTKGLYEHSFGGTSSATPLVAGCVALMIEANPNLGWRDVKEILIRTARKVDVGNADWVNNAAGFHFNHEYGAGLMDAQAAVNMAKTWSNLGAQTSQQLAQTGLSVSIPDNNGTGVTRTFSVPANPATRVEHVTVTVTATHTRRGDLEVILTAPSGVQSILFVPHTTDINSGMNWTFSTVRNWGETAAGNWSVKVADRRASTVGTLTGVTLKVFGSSLAAPPSAPVITSATSATGTLTQTFNYQIAASNNPSSFGVTNLPAGLSFNAGSGLISGIPTQSGTFNNVGISATNAGGTGNTTLTITVNPAPVQAPIINSSTSVTGTVGQSFNYQITATNSPTGYNATNLPAGLSVNTNTGAISGTPTQSGTFNTIAISATNSAGTGNATLTITVNNAVPNAPVITSATTGTATVGQAYVYQITATNSPGSYGATNLPPGLTLSAGQISGTPTQSGTFNNIGLSATNAGGTGNATLTLTISPAPTPLPSITSTLSANGMVGQAFSYQIVATNSPTSYAASGLPTGLSIVSGTGLISGSPSGAGVSNVSISATNSAGTDTKTLIITVNAVGTGLSAALESAYTFGTSGNANWSSQTVTTFDGVDAAKSGTISHNEETLMQTEVDGPGYVRFFFKTSTEENFDFFFFQIDGETLWTYSGDNVWSEVGFYVPAGSHTLSWIYVKDGSDSFGSDAVYIDSVTFTSQQSCISSALDLSTLTWSTTGNKYWIFRDYNTAGDDAMISPEITHGQSASVEATVMGPGTLTFWWLVNSELNGDLFRFEIDGVQQNVISGNTEWAQLTVNVPNGTHQLRWRYNKNNSITNGLDAAWLDEVTYAPNLAAGGAYQQWINSQFAAPVQGDGVIVGASADPDGDGRNNASEYAFGGNPNYNDKATGSGAVQQVLSQAQFTYTVDTSKNDLTIIPETAQSLTGTWATATSELISTAGSIQTRRVNLSNTPTAVFFRINATLAP